jgi:hypothetical protein
MTRAGTLTAVQRSLGQFGGQHPSRWREMIAETQRLLAHRA